MNNIWESWFRFRQGKRKTKEIENFQYYLEKNLWRLHADLNKGKYVHGPYRHFTVSDSKRRDIAVADIPDRVVHRLLYEYLVDIYDKIFIFDAWSCRKDKGLVGAIDRTEKFFRKYAKSFVWRADITKFFDNIRQESLLAIIARRVKDEKAIWLIKQVIGSYNADGQCAREKDRKITCGIPIGNLTSQIFANIYLNEFDRFVKHILKPQFYLRYGDDFIIITSFGTEAEKIRQSAIAFLQNRLGLVVNRKNDIIIPASKGIYFLGVEIFPTGRRLKKRGWQNAQSKLMSNNAASYRGLIQQCYPKKLPYFDWLITNFL
ncbi:MAG: group II intron reverse transcriptase domain-containing protein [Parcubacteria group bacterium]|nr:group II intron reverse transcriptase domain-containing protein [Parcubacteria group bacterium]